MKKLMINLALAIGLAGSSAMVAPAFAQVEDDGYVMQVLSAQTGCSVCYQSCVLQSAVQMFDYNIPALMEWLAGLTASYNVWSSLMDDDVWFFEFPLISNRPAPVTAEKHLYFPEYAVPLLNTR